MKTFEQHVFERLMELYNTWITAMTKQTSRLVIPTTDILD